MVVYFPWNNRHLLSEISGMGYSSFLILILFCPCFFFPFNKQKHHAVSHLNWTRGSRGPAWGPELICYSAGLWYTVRYFYYWLIPRLGSSHLLHWVIFVSFVCLFVIVIVVVFLLGGGGGIFEICFRTVLTMPAADRLIFYFKTCLMYLPYVNVVIAPCAIEFSYFSTFNLSKDDWV